MAVVPSHAKGEVHLSPRPTHRGPVETGWMRQIDVSMLAHAEKFKADPKRPPTYRGPAAAPPVLYNVPGKRRSTLPAMAWQWSMRPLSAQPRAQLLSDLIAWVRERLRRPPS